MKAYTTGMGWDESGNLLESDGKFVTLDTDNLIINMVMTHLLTEPAANKLATTLGFGLRQFLAGKNNTSDTRNLIQKTINDYFSSNTTFLPYYVSCKVSETSEQDEIMLIINITGPNSEQSVELLIGFGDGRIIYAKDFLNTEDEVISTTDIELGTDVNPYLSRLAKQRADQT